MLLLLANGLSAVLFIASVSRPVFDDEHNSFDVTRYATEGVSVDTLRRHLNPAAPGSYIWMSLPAWVLGPELWVFRAAALGSWVILGLGVYGFVRCTGGRDYLYASLAVPLVFPHACLTMSTVLTEGPSLMFAVMGSLLWVYGQSAIAPTLRQCGAAVMGGLCMGLAVFCRQYYLALVPAMAVAAGLICLKRGWPRPAWWVSAALSGLAALLPATVLVLIWGGFTSPGMATGASYDGVWTAKIGLSLIRPIVGAWYTCIYLLPFTFPAIFQLTKRQHLYAGAVALISFGTMLATQCDVLQWGPINSGVGALARRIGHAPLIVAVLTGVIGYSVYAVGTNAFRKWRRLVFSPYSAFSLAFLLFFVAEQIGVGGNIQFYERYMLQAAPFIGLLAFRILPKVDRPRLGIVALLFILSQVMLWRYALTT